MRKTYLEAHYPKSLSTIQKIQGAIQGIFLTPFFILLAARLGVPGLDLHFKSILLGLRLLTRIPRQVPMNVIYNLIFFPMDSTRYFELDFMWKMSSDINFGRYLDISSPRLFPTLYTMKNLHLEADLVNPDRRDLGVTAKIVKSLPIRNRCRLHALTLDSVPFEPETFELITSISVLEHIPDDKQAVRKMWELLKPTARLLLSVPCAVEASEQYIDQNFFNILEPDERGYFFWQRFYDEELIEENIYSITGKPSFSKLYGEKKKGAFQQNALQKRSDPMYPSWREPYMMGKEYTLYHSIADLPGEGVVAMEFIKS